MGKKNPTISADFDEFWHEDAVAAAERERVDETGFRMPAASSPSVPAALSPSNEGSVLSELQNLSPRQLAFAFCLGVEVQANDTPESISRRIDYTKARANGYSVNSLQQSLAGRACVDIEDCETRSEAAWALWSEYEDDPEGFFALVPVRWQRQFCGGSASSLSAAVAYPLSAVSHNAVASRRCAQCQEAVSHDAIVCRHCGQFVSEHAVWATVGFVVVLIIILTAFVKLAL